MGRGRGGGKGAVAFVGGRAKNALRGFGVLLLCSASLLLLLSSATVAEANEITTSAKSHAAHLSGVSKALKGADPWTMDDAIPSSGKEVATPKTLVRAPRDGSQPAPSDEASATAGVLFAKTTPREPEESHSTGKITHTPTTKDAARVSTREITSDILGDASMPGTDNPDRANARHSSTANAEDSHPHWRPHKGKAKHNATNSDVVPPKVKRNDLNVEAPRIIAHHAKQIGIEDSKDTASDRTDAGEEPATRVDDGGAAHSFSVNDYYAAMVLIASIVFLAVLPSGGGSRHAPAEPDSEAAAATRFGEDTTDALQEFVSRNSNAADSELGASTLTKTGSSAARTSGFWAVITSSKMLFMVNFVLWVSLAMGFSAYGKGYLRDTREPMGLLLLQGITGIAVLGALGKFRGIDLYPKDGYATPAAARRVALAASMHTGQALLTNFAVLLGGVAATNALKAMEPIAAAAFSYFLLGKSCSRARLASIFVIAAGIVVFTATSSAGAKGGGKGAGGQGGSGGQNEGGFSDGAIVGISTITVVAAVCCNALRNVFIKKGDPIPPHQTLFACSVVAAVVGVSMMFLRLSFRVMDDLSYVGVSGGEHTGNNTNISGGGGGGGGSETFDWIRVTGFNASLCFVGYNFASFNLLVRLTPVGHAVGNSFKRVLVFAGGILFLGEFMNARQLGGAALALAGVLAYNVSGAKK